MRSPFCRLENEFKETVAGFEKEAVDAIVTLHMAYSPSLESIDVLCNTKLPIIVLDTTETFEFSATQNSSEIGYCHGFHFTKIAARNFSVPYCAFYSSAKNLKNSYKKSMLERRSRSARSISCSSSWLLFLYSDMVFPK